MSESELLRAVKDFLRAWYGVDQERDINRLIEDMATAYEEEEGDWTDD